MIDTTPNDLLTGAKKTNIKILIIFIISKVVCSERI